MTQFQDRKPLSKIEQSLFWLSIDTSSPLLLIATSNTLGCVHYSENIALYYFENLQRVAVDLCSEFGQLLTQNAKFNDYMLKKVHAFATVKQNHQNNDKSERIKLLTDGTSMSACKVRNRFEKVISTF